MRISWVLSCATLVAFAQQWPLGLPGAPSLHRISQSEVPRWGVLYVEVEYFVDPKASVLEEPIGALESGRVWCGSRVTVLQPISARKRRESLEEQYRAYWPGGYDPKAASARAFLAWAARPLKERDVLEYVADPAGRLHGRLNGGAWTAFEGRDLVQAWLGYTFQGNPRNPGILASVRAYLEGLRKAAPLN
jgi:hypothetical protein